MFYQVQWLWNVSFTPDDFDVARNLTGARKRFGWVLLKKCFAACIEEARAEKHSIALFLYNLCATVRRSINSRPLLKCRKYSVDAVFFVNFQFFGGFQHFSVVCFVLFCLLYFFLPLVGRFFLLILRILASFFHYFYRFSSCFETFCGACSDFRLSSASIIFVILIY